jgi:hypothetical protein
LRYNFRALANLHASDRARSHFFERLVIQLARVVFPHAVGESYSILRVKRNVGLLTARLIEALDSAHSVRRNTLYGTRYPDLVQATGVLGAIFEQKI